MSIRTGDRTLWNREKGKGRVEFLRSRGFGYRIFMHPCGDCKKETEHVLHWDPEKGNGTLCVFCGAFNPKEEKE